MKRLVPFLDYWFVRACLWCVEYELAIARSTGRNPDNIEKLNNDENFWTLQLWYAEQNLRGAA